VLTLIGLLAAFLLPISLGILLARLLVHFVPELRTNMYVTGFGYSIANWTTVALFLLFVFPEIDMNLAEIGFNNTISLVEVGLASFSVLVSITWFALTSKLGIFKPESQGLRIENRSQLLLLIFYAPITAAFCEEFFYRGFAITALNSGLGNIWIAGIISSVIFALMHIPRHGLVGFANTGVIGLLLMTVFILTGSIYPGIIAHSIVDFVGFVIVPLARSRGGKV